MNDMSGMMNMMKGANCKFPLSNFDSTFSSILTYLTCICECHMMRRKHDVYATKHGDDGFCKFLFRGFYFGEDSFSVAFQRI